MGNKTSKPSKIYQKDGELCQVSGNINGILWKGSDSSWWPMGNWSKVRSKLTNISIWGILWRSLKWQQDKSTLSNLSKWSKTIPSVRKYQWHPQKNGQIVHDGWLEINLGTLKSTKISIWSILLGALVWQQGMQTLSNLWKLSKTMPGIRRFQRCQQKRVR